MKNFHRSYPKKTESRCVQPNQLRYVRRIVRKTGGSSFFWKNKSNDFSLFTYESDARRESYRLRPPEGEVITVTLGENEYVVIDIGGGGLSFENTDFTEGDGGPVILRLPGRGKAIAAVLEIRGICKNGICHCAFIEIADDDVGKIHQYMLEKQKEFVRSRRQGRNFPGQRL